MSEKLRLVIEADASEVARAAALGRSSLRSLGAEADVQSRKSAALTAAGKRQAQTLREIGRAARTGMVATGVAAAAAIASTVSVGATYEKQLDRVKGVTDANRVEMARLNDQALKLGQDTKFSATEAAQGMYELASAGFTVRESQQALPGMLDLAASSSIELADASDIASSALRGFKLDAKESGHVADVMAESVNRSNLEMVDLQYSLKYIGPIAATTGQSLETITAALSMMADAGIRGEQAGTTLRGGLTRLVKPTKMVKDGLRDLGLSSKDLYGPDGLKPLPELIGLITKGSEGLTKAERNRAIAQVFGTEALSGMVAVIDQGAPKLERLTKAYEHSDGAAKKAAKTMNDNVAGAFEQVQGAVETAQIKLFQRFAPQLKDFLLQVSDDIQEATGDVEEWFDALDKDPEFKAADTLGEKLAVVGRHLEEAGVPDKLEELAGEGMDLAAKAISAAAPKVADAAANVAPKAAKAFAEAWVGADIWGRLVVGGYLLHKMGGLAAFRELGRQGGAAMGTGLAQGAAGGAVAGAGIGAAIGGAATQQTVQWVKGPGGAMVAQIGTSMAEGAAPGFRQRFTGALRAMGPGLAISAALIVGPELVKAIDEKAYPVAQNGLPKTGDAISKGLRETLGDSLDLGDALRVWSDPSKFSKGLLEATGIKEFPEAEDRLREFGDTVERELDRARKAGDTRALERLSAQARDLARDFPDARNALKDFQREVQASMDLKLDLDPADAMRQVRELRAAFRALSTGPGLKLDAVRREMRNNWREIRRTFEDGSQASKDAMAKNIRAGIKAIDSSMRDGTISTKTGMAEILRLTRRNTGASKDAVSKNFDAAADAIESAMRRGVVATDEGTKLLRGLVADQLKVYGVDPKKALHISKQTTNSADAFYLAGHGTFKQRGGPIDMGKPEGDSVPAMLERGEYVLNREAVRKVGRDALDALNFAAAPRFQGGGIVGIPWQPGEEVAASILPILTQLHRQFGFTVTDAFDRDRSAGHKSPGHNITGTAVDAAGGNLAGLVEWAVRNGLTTYWNGGHGATPLAGHDDHAHIEFGSGGNFAAAAAKIARVVVEGPDSPLKSMVQGALDATHKAAQQYADQQMGSLLAAPPSGAPGAGLSGPWVSVLEQIAKQKGWSAEDWKTLVNKESGGNPAAVNPSSGAYGLGQFLGSTKDAYAQYGATSADGADQIRAMAKYIEDRYGNPTKALAFHNANNWYAKGGLVGLVGDSLGVGTVPYLRGKLGGLGLDANVLQGRPPSAGLAVLKTMLDARHGQFVFDLGTNGATGELAAALKQADKLTGKRPLHALTINSPLDAAGKNARLRGLAGGDINLIDWASRSGGLLAPDGYHATAAGYKERAAMVAAAVKRKQRELEKAEKGKGKKRGKRKLTPDQQRAKKVAKLKAAAEFTPRELLRKLGRYNALGESAVDLEALFGQAESRYNLDDVLTETELNDLLGRKEGKNGLLDVYQRRLKLGQTIDGNFGDTLAVVRAQYQRQMAKVRKNMRDLSRWERELEKVEKRIKLNEAGKKRRPVLLEQIQRIDAKKKPNAADRSRRERLVKELAGIEGDARKGSQHAGEAKRLRDQLAKVRKDNRRLTGQDEPSFGYNAKKGSLVRATQDAIGKFREEISKVRESLRPAGIPGDIADTQLDIARLRAEGATKPEAQEDRTREMLDMQRQISMNLARDLAVSNARFDVYGGMQSLIGGQFVGQYAHGTRRAPATGWAWVHRDEEIRPDPEGPYGSQIANSQTGPASTPEVTVNLYGDAAPLMRNVEVMVDGKMAKARVQSGRQARLLKTAPGRGR